MATRTSVAAEKKPREKRTPPKQAAGHHQVVSTALAPAAIGPYSQAVVATGPFLFVSGCIGLHPQVRPLHCQNYCIPHRLWGGQTMDFTGADVSTQTEQVMQNMGAILEAGGSSFAEVVKCTILLTDMQHFATVNDIYAKCNRILPHHTTTHARPDSCSKPLTGDDAQTSRETHQLAPRLRPTVSPRARWWRLSASPLSHRRRREPGRLALHRVPGLASIEWWLPKQVLTLCLTTMATHRKRQGEAGAVKTRDVVATQL